MGGLPSLTLYGQLGTIAPSCGRQKGRDTPEVKSMRSPWLIISLAVFALLALLAACGGGDDTTSVTPTPAASDVENARPTPKPVGVTDLAHAVVKSSRRQWRRRNLARLRHADLSRRADPDERPRGRQPRRGVRHPADRAHGGTDQAPDVKYTAEIQTVDYAIDLAVIKITEDRSAATVTDTFPFVASATPTTSTSATPSRSWATRASAARRSRSRAAPSAASRPSTPSATAPGSRQTPRSPAATAAASP